MTTHTHPQILVNTTPGAPEALTALEHEVSTLIDLNHEFRVLGDRLVAASTRRDGALIKRPEVSTADYDALTAARADMQNRIRTQNRRIDSARKCLDELIHSLSAEEKRIRRSKIAAHTISKHAEAVRLWDELQHTLTDRDTAYTAIGRPGNDWKKALGAVPNRFDGGVTDVKNIMEARVGRFDVETLNVLASGESVATHAERLAASRAAVAKAAAETAQAIRKRG